MIIRTNKPKQDSYPATLAYSSTEKALARSNVETIDWNLEPRKGDTINDGPQFSEKETSKTRSQVVGTPKDREDSNFTFAQKSKKDKNQSSFFPHIDNDLRAVEETSSVESREIFDHNLGQDLVESLLIVNEDNRSSKGKPSIFEVTLKQTEIRRQMRVKSKTFSKMEFGTCWRPRGKKS